MCCENICYLCQPPNKACDTEITTLMHGREHLSQDAARQRGKGWPG